MQNYDTMTTTGASLGKSPRVTNIGFNQDDRNKQEVTRNTVVGNAEIGKTSEGSINRDVMKANEVTRDVQHSTNINVESQTIEYATNPGKLKEDLNKAKDEIKDVTKALDNSIHDPGDDNRNFFGQLRETRLSETVENIAGERLKVASTQNEIKSAFEEAYSDLGYKAEIKFSTPEETSELKDKAGTAYVSSTGVHTMIININAKENSTKSGLIGTISEEGSHIINGVEGRQIETGTEEKGLESTGRATNSYFQDKYRDDKTTISMKSDGTIDTSKLGTHVGDRIFLDATSDITDEDRKKILDTAQEVTNYKLKLSTKKVCISSDSSKKCGYEVEIEKDEKGNPIKIVVERNKDKTVKRDSKGNIITRVLKPNEKEYKNGNKLVSTLIEKEDKVFITNEKDNIRKQDKWISNNESAASFDSNFINGKKEISYVIKLDYSQPENQYEWNEKTKISEKPSMIEQTNDSRKFAILSHEMIHIYHYLTNSHSGKKTGISYSYLKDYNGMKIKPDVWLDENNRKVNFGMYMNKIKPSLGYIEEYRTVGLGFSEIEVQEMINNNRWEVKGKYNKKDDITENDIRQEQGFRLRTSYNMF